MVRFKFRGKRIDNGEFVEGSLHEDSSGNCHILENCKIASHLYSSDVRIYSVYADSVELIKQ